MPLRNVRVTVDERRSVTAICHEPEGRANGIVFVYAPGAGSNVDDPFGRYVSGKLASKGFTCLRTQFPYMEEKRRAPDRTAVLEKTWRAVIAEARALGEKVIVSGRSMGGRIASHVVARGERVNALTLFAYPLHSPAKPDAWRDAHLPSVTVTTLFCSGTRDGFATPDELQTVAKTMTRATVHLLNGADHGYSVLAASGRRREDVWAEAVGRMLSWLREERVT